MKNQIKNFDNEETEAITNQKSNPVTKWIAHFFNRLEKKPKSALLYMGLILGLAYSINLAIQMYSNQEESKVSFSDTKGKLTNELTSPSSANYSLQNYQIMTRLKDSLEILMAKGDNLSREDTLSFLRIIDQFHKIDPSLVETVMSLKKAQQEYPIDEHIDIDALSAEQDAYFNEIFKQHK